MDSDLIGLHEIAMAAGVTPSAVVNWRKRFVDFPSPVVELKSGPVFRAVQIYAWLEKRQRKELGSATRLYDQLAAKRNDDASLISKIEEAAHKLADENTSVRSPGMLLGKIQSGKTRAFLGIIARCFDLGYELAVVLTKGTTSLARQTLMRIKKDFADFIQTDEVQVYDVMSLPNLTPYELNQKLILVVKKEDDNMSRLIESVEVKYPVLKNKRLLIVDDEADFTSVSYKKKDGVVGVGKIYGQIDYLRNLVEKSDFLQVTATPYALYLQPEEGIVEAGVQLFKPLRPKFTVVLPVHDSYVGGDYYFEKSTEPDSPAYYFYREVPLEEREALKKEDRRRIKIENVLTEKRVAVLRDAVLTFMVGGTVRRLQSMSNKERPQKYSFLFHTEQARSSHDWQEEIATAIRDGLVSEAAEDSPLFNEIMLRAFSDLKRSIQLADSLTPSFEDVKGEVVRALVEGQMMITKVNSDKDVEELLDEDGQLKLRTPFNIFIGGQILDRGITIRNLIVFYYGRSPKRFQQDTVLQHSRMYGARSMADLAVTRFYAPQHVYQVMRKIHAFDVALREAFESGAHDRGVYFIQKDARGVVVPCSPNKLMFSEVTSVRPGRRMLPVGFQTVSKTAGAKRLASLDARVRELVGDGNIGPVLVGVQDAAELLGLAYENLEFERAEEDPRKAHAAALEHLSRTCKDSEMVGKVWLLVSRDRDVARYREEGRFSNAPDTKQQTELALAKAEHVPVLMLLRQNGDEKRGWRNLPFWWPVIVPPKTAVTSIFASDVPSRS
ncbi:Serine phosphatase RsbU, regulator of sigma subunit [Myxococcus hansupus]|uniref:Serine phosphatase RsbU, regulator of sigma subunit n=1 Tax=Pseudomyxococcus hansupus TaxID=1297742 RepID=A0A0H4XAG6_9BACT|nr:Z1 domain-containing protein [Myxococcus hansupus]AKQ70660.1 Serine phosphatase RsbU, regulator of sigma subunit [Myxococcus hansupus]